MHSLKPYHTPEKGVSNLINPAMLVDDGIIEGKDGSYTVGWFYQGPDTASATFGERNYLTAILNNGLAHFNGDVIINQYAVRVPASGYPDASRSAFPDFITQLIDAEFRESFETQGNHFETHLALILTYTPPSPQNSKLTDLMYRQETNQPLQYRDKQLQAFKKMIQDFEDLVSTVLTMERMRSYLFTDAYGREHLRDDLVEFFHARLTGLHHPLNIPAMYLDSFLGSQELWVGDTPKIGENYICCVSLEGFPMESFPNMLNIFDHFAISFYLANRHICLSSHQSTGAMKANRRTWKQKETPFLNQVFKIHTSLRNDDAAHMAHQAEAAMNDAHSGLVGFGYFTSVVVLMGPDLDTLEENARIMIREIQREGFAARLETINTLEAWLGSLPGHAHPNVRRALISTQNFADLMSSSSVFAGAETCPNPLYPPNSPPLMFGATSGSTPFRFHLHQGDVGHTLVFGPTGSGKSTLLATKVAQFLRYPNASVFAFDKGNSLWALTHAVGGNHYDIGASNSPQFTPLLSLETENDMTAAAEWLETCFELQAGKSPTPRQKESIFKALKLFRDATEPEHRSLTDYLSTLQDEEVRSALNYYTVSGNLGSLLDSEQDGLRDSHFTVIEVEELMGMGDKAAIPVLLYLFRRFEKSLKGQPALLVLDEAWVMLGHPVFREKIREWLKVLRKANCAVVLATQSLSDAVRSGIFDVLVESCPTKILLPNEEADKKGTEQHFGPKDLYTIMGLNEAQIQIIKNGIKKRHYYYVSGAGRRLFELNLGPVALSFVAVSDKQTIAHLKALKEEHGENWPIIWLKERRVNYEALLN